MAPRDSFSTAVNNEEVCKSAASVALEFGDANLRAIAEVYSSEGDEEFRKKEFDNAIHLYTEGIKVNCNNKELNAKLYSNRARAYNCLGGYNEALRDAKASRKLQPSCIKAFTAGAQACLKLNLLKEAIAWCDDGLAINRENQLLFELKKESIKKLCELLESVREKMKTTETKMNKGGDQIPKTFSPLNLDIAKKVGNRKKVGLQYLKLGNGFLELSNFQEAIDNYKKYLSICKEQEDKNGEGHAYGRLGSAYNSVGKVKKAMKYYQLQFSTAGQVGDKLEEGIALSSLGNLFDCIGDFNNAIEYHELHLKITIMLRDRSGEGYAYRNLGNTFHKLGLCKNAMAYHERNLKIVIEQGDRIGEEKAYGNLGRVHRSLGDIERAIEYHELQRSIAKEEGMKADEACAYYELGCSLEFLGSEMEALEYYKSCARLFEEIRAGIPYKQTNFFKDKWKINLFDVYQCVYTALCRLYLNLNMPMEALAAAEKGRAQALLDFLRSHFGINSTQIPSCEQGHTIADILKYGISSNTIFLGLDNNNINIWLLQPGHDIVIKRRSVGDTDFHGIFKSLEDDMHIYLWTAGLCEVVKGEVQSILGDKSPLRIFYDCIIGPIANLLHGDELIIVPEGPLCLVPFAILTDPVGRYLCESFKIRIAPSLTSLKLIADSPQGYHSNSGALLVGDPSTEEIISPSGYRLLDQIPLAREEVEMIGHMTNISPLIGPRATKTAVLQRLSCDALIHIAAHGAMKSGKIALAPNPTRPSRTPLKEDFVLTMAEVLNVKVRAKLVVLSCCHTGRGQIKAEGVVGIARAFLAAGARSVVASLWAIDDEATFEFMKSFYQRLLQGNSSSTALNKSINCLRESEKFSEVRFWAPFVLIGDDVTLEFLHKPCTMAETKNAEENAPDVP